MPRGVHKSDLPSKMCVVCERPFTWRKKWERCWEEVTTCSKRCNAERRRVVRVANKNQGNNRDKGGSSSSLEEEGNSDSGSSSSGGYDGGFEDSSVVNRPGGGDSELPAEPGLPAEEEQGGGGEEKGDENDSQSESETGRIGGVLGEREAARQARKAQKKLAKQARRAKRAGMVDGEEGDPHGLSAVVAQDGKKACEMCGRLVDLLVRCQKDDSKKWFLVCGGKCWKEVSGGVADGDKSRFPHYRYGGLWKNRRAKGPVPTKPPPLPTD